MWVREIHDDDVQNHLLSRLNVKKNLRDKMSPKGEMKNGRRGE